MIIDQLPLLSTDVQGTDEIPIERGTSTYKTTQAALVKSVADDVDRRGLPVGGSAGEILAKVDGTDYNTQWIDPPDPSGFVSYAQSQTLTDAQQAQARTNIGANWTLLWQNASPTSDFLAQTITIDMSDYDYIVIEGLANKAGYRNDAPGWTVFLRVVVGYIGAIGTIACGDVAEYRYMLTQRKVNIVSLTQLSIGQNEYARPSAYTTNRQDLTIPLFVYGLKVF